jgi:kinetochor protein Mis14/NSL1
MDISTHPNPTPNPHHRKIDLQFHADLVYLQSNLSTAATQHLNLHFPLKHAYATHIPLSPSTVRDEPGETQIQADPMRTRVEELIRDFVHRTWDSAKHSVSVNGLDATGVSDYFSPHTADMDTAVIKEEREGVDFAYEAYDPRLSTRVASLYAEVEGLTGEVSNLRRTNPKVGAETYENQLRDVMEEDQNVFEVRREEAQKQPQNILEMKPLPEDVPEMYERGLSGLAGLSGLNKSQQAGQKKSSLTETVGKVQRARRVVGELE